MLLMDHLVVSTSVVMIHCIFFSAICLICAVILIYQNVQFWPRWRLVRHNANNIVFISKVNCIDLVLVTLVDVLYTVSIHPGYSCLLSLAIPL